MNEKIDYQGKPQKCNIATVMKEITRSGEGSWIQSEWRLPLWDNWPH